MIERTPLDARPHVLYRLRSSSGELLYVGITSDLEARWRRHSDTKEWWPDVVSAAVCTFPDRRSALDAEREAISSESPRHNVSRGISDLPPSGADALRLHEERRLSPPVLRPLSRGDLLGLHEWCVVNEKAWHLHLLREGMTRVGMEPPRLTRRMQRLVRLATS